jgi:hypothetical protein
MAKTQTNMNPGYFRGIPSDCTALEVFLISTEGPYYGMTHLQRADDRRMMKLEKTQQWQELYCFLIFFAGLCTGMVWWLCSLL